MERRPDVSLRLQHLPLAVSHPAAPAPSGAPRRATSGSALDAHSSSANARATRWPRTGLKELPVVNCEPILKARSQRQILRALVRRAEPL